MLLGPCAGASRAFNRVTHAQDDSYAWGKLNLPVLRRVLIAAIAKANPDVIGLQEPTPKQVQQIKQGLADSYNCVSKSVRSKLEVREFLI